MTNLIKSWNDRNIRIRSDQEDKYTPLTEEWRPVVGYEGFYEVSSHGQVRSLDRLTMLARGGTRKMRGRVLKQSLCRGYRVISLCGIGEQIEKKVHQLVAESFLSKGIYDSQINHIDGCKTNNNVSNLEWCTAQKNSRHARQTGLCDHFLGENHHCSKLRSTDIPLIRQRLSNGDSLSEIARNYGVSITSIDKIKRGRSWANV